MRFQGSVLGRLDSIPAHYLQRRVLRLQNQSIEEPPTASAKISIIIPVLNEAGYLAQTLAMAQTARNCEILVVDGGSWDGTLHLAETLGARVIAAKPGRSSQMNVGAVAASGDILLFLHGDTRLPEEFDRFVRETLAMPNTVAGAFRLAIDGNSPALRLVEWGVNLRSRLLQLPYGDQALFLTRATFHTLGGFPDLPIMEDFELVRQLRKLGMIRLLPVSVLTSGRRWQKLGIVKTTLINQLAIVAYLVGIAPAQIARWYRRN